MLEIKNISFWYDLRDLPVVLNCNFKVDPRHTVSIIGNSGCGKSTLLRISAGVMQSYIKKYPESGYKLTGHVQWKGVNITGPNKDFGYVPQNYSATLIQGKTALQNVLWAVKENGISLEEKKLAEELMTASNIWEQRDISVQYLSGGQQQRVAICRALITRPQMVFMDEPFANLDASLTPDITGLMNKLKEDFEISVMIVTHDLKLAHQNSNVILKMTVKNGIPVSKYVW